MKFYLIFGKNSLFNIKKKNLRFFQIFNQQKNVVKFQNQKINGPGGLFRL